MDEQKPGSPPAAAATPPELPLPQAMAQLWRERAGIIAARVFMDTQALFGVGAIPPDPVIVRIIVLQLADAVEQGDRARFLYAFTRSGREVGAQINDQTIPYRPGLQISGHIEGVLRDTLVSAFKSDPPRQQAALDLLTGWCAPGYPALLGEPAALVKNLAPLS